MTVNNHSFNNVSSDKLNKLDSTNNLTKITPIVESSKNTKLSAVIKLTKLVSQNVFDAIKEAFISYGICYALNRFQFQAFAPGYLSIYPFLAQALTVTGIILSIRSVSYIAMKLLGPQPSLTLQQNFKSQSLLIKCRLIAWKILNFIGDQLTKLDQIYSNFFKVKDFHILNAALKNNSLRLGQLKYPEIIRQIFVEQMIGIFSIQDNKPVVTTDPAQSSTQSPVTSFNLFKAICYDAGTRFLLKRQWKITHFPMGVHEAVFFNGICFFNNFMTKLKEVWQDQDQDQGVVEHKQNLANKLTEKNHNAYKTRKINTLLEKEKYFINHYHFDLHFNVPESVPAFEKLLSHLSFKAKKFSVELNSEISFHTIYFKKNSQMISDKQWVIFNFTCHQKKKISIVKNSENNVVTFIESKIKPSKQKLISCYPLNQERRRAILV